MTAENMDKHAAEALARFERIHAFVIASIQQARNHHERIEEQLEVEESNPMIGKLERLKLELGDWLARAEHLRSWLLQKSHDVGVMVEKARMGVLDGGLDDVRRLAQDLGDHHRNIAVAFLEAAGRNVYHQTLSLAEDLLQNEDSLVEATDEFESVRRELGDEIESILDSEVESPIQTDRERTAQTDSVQ